MLLRMLICDGRPGTQIVLESLFTLYPPAPLSEEEVQLEASQKAAIARKKVHPKPHGIHALLTSLPRVL